MSLMPYYDANPSIYEIGVDESGRGPFFGRVYAAAVILPKDDSFHHSLMKDSKRFHSKKKIQEAYDYIQLHALDYSVAYSDETLVDQINILQATQDAMHRAILDIEKKYSFQSILLVDGNYFKPFTQYNKQIQRIESIPHVCIEGGDNKYTAIAAASILAKVERDKYIEEMCALHPELIERYDLAKNKGYGTKKHLAGIAQYGRSPWHRQSFRIKGLQPTEGLQPPLKEASDPVAESERTA